MNILALGAHPDDIEFGCAGTLAKYANNGHTVYLMVMTRGEKGGDGEERATEQKKAREILMAKRIFWGGFSDTFPPAQKDLIDAIERVIENVDPKMIFVNFSDDTHQDHRELARALNSAARNIRNVMYYEVPSTQHFTPKVFVDIERFMDIKKQALMAHHSQMMKTNIEGLSILEISRSLANYRGIQARIRFAEAFCPERLIINL
ncbi:MAG: PIG-L family deacetylase [Deltaproteobacteria bacterium]|nr:PIG-L family deacetylase [Candidatus Zymogenaceae bacterium]